MIFEALYAMVSWFVRGVRGSACWYGQSGGDAHDSG